MTIKKLILVYFTVIFCNNSTFAQIYGTGAYYSLQHSVGTTLLESHSATNAAAMALDTSDFLIVHSKPSRFGISELSPFMLMTSIELDSNRIFGANISGLGGELYSEVSAELRFAQKVGNILSLGASFEYSRLSIKNYGLESIGMFNIGALLSLSNDLKAGFLLRNLLRNYTSESDKSVYQQSVIGISYKISPELFVDVDASVVINSNTSLGIGFKYIPHEEIAVRSAFRSNPNLLEMAVLTKIFSETHLLLGFEYNEIFGISPEIAIKYAF